jgi:formylglycine-generating enzyme required for sulfatase activity
VIEVSKEGYEAKSEEIELGAGEDRHISLGLSPILEPDLVDEGKPEVSIAEPAETEPSEPEAAEPESLKPRAAEPTKAEAPEQVRKSRALLIGVSAGLALLLLLVGLWRFLPQRQPEKKVSPVESQPVIKEPKTITNSIGMKFVLIPAGTFQMGSPKGESGRDEDERQHQVTISRPFYLQTTEVTQGQWQKVMGNNPSHFKKCGQDCPVEQVSWDDAQEFIKKLNQMEKTNNYRLPTEAEWEYACRAGSTNEWCFGNEEAKLGEYGWYVKNSGGQTHPVGQLMPNAWGLYDMHGNVYEWCQDWLGDYPAGPVTDPQGPRFGEDRVLRGGSWANDATELRSANRYQSKPGDRSDTFGFRVARTL